MSREELLELCHFYDGENECPSEFNQTSFGQLWRAEQMLCEDILCDNPNIPMDNPRKTFYEYVALYVEKWNPYGYKEVMDVYERMAYGGRSPLIGDYPMDGIVPFERHEGGVTPGAAYNIGYFYDKNGYPCNKEDAYRVCIIEFDKDDNCLQETYGFLR